VKFEYQAKTKTGDTQAGKIEASSKEAALVLLQKYGLYVISIKAGKSGPVYLREIKLFQGVSKKDKMMFARQLSIMFKSKVALVEALRVLTTQTSNAFFREKIAKMADDVESGTSLSKALSRFPDVFSPFFINMVKSGETVGKLTGSLDYLSDHLEREYQFSSRVLGALLYPIMVIIVMLGVVLIMIFFVFPQITKIVDELGVEPPLLTKIIFGFVNFIKKWFIVIIIGFTTLILFILQYLKTKEGKNLFGRFSLKVPIVGSLLKMIYLARLAENLSTLMSGGLQIASSLEISGEVVGNEAYKKVIFETRDAVRTGDTISSVLRKHPVLFPPLFTQMTLVGEKTGTLDQTLMHLVSFFQKEVDRNLESALSLIVPITMIFLGVVVGGLIGSVFLTLYKVVGSM